MFSVPRIRICESDCDLDYSSFSWYELLPEDQALLDEYFERGGLYFYAYFSNGFWVLTDGVGTYWMVDPDDPDGIEQSTVRIIFDTPSAFPF